MDLPIETTYRNLRAQLVSVADRIPDVSTGRALTVNVANLTFMDGTVYGVTSSSSDNKYATRVTLSGSAPTHNCECMDWRQRRHPCKHVAAVVGAMIRRVDRGLEALSDDAQRLAAADEWIQRQRDILAEREAKLAQNTAEVSAYYARVLTDGG